MGNDVTVTRRYSAGREATVQVDRYEPTKASAFATVEVRGPADELPPGEELLAELRAEVDADVREQARQLRIWKASLGRFVAANGPIGGVPPRAFVWPAVGDDEDTYYIRVDRETYEDEVALNEGGY